MPLCCVFASRRRHTRYWRDWSSDVCSSDLERVELHKRLPTRERGAQRQVAGPRRLGVHQARQAGGDDGPILLAKPGIDQRSEERRGGKGWRSRLLPDHLKKKINTNKLVV